MTGTDQSDKLTAWWAGEDAVRLSCVPRLLPQKIDGSVPSQRSVYLWATKGIGGIKLRRFRNGGQWCTTKQELVRWQVRLTEADRR